jgi:hypothetical protein
MPPELPKPGLPLEYLTPQGLGRSKRSLLRTVGIHFIAGSGASILIAAFLIMWRQRRDYPPTLACGGTFVVVIQWFLLALPAICRQLLWRQQLLVERSTLGTVVAGLVGGCLVFGVPLLVDRFTSNTAIGIIAAVLPLCVYPTLVSFVVFRSQVGVEI